MSQAALLGQPLGGGAAPGIGPRRFLPGARWYGSGGGWRTDSWLRVCVWDSYALYLASRPLFHL